MKNRSDSSSRQVSRERRAYLQIRRLLRKRGVVEHTVIDLGCGYHLVEYTKPPPKTGSGWFIFERKHKHRTEFQVYYTTSLLSQVVTARYQAIMRGRRRDKINTSNQKDQ